MSIQELVGIVASELGCIEAIEENGFYVVYRFASYEDAKLFYKWLMAREYECSAISDIGEAYQVYVWEVE